MNCMKGNTQWYWEQKQQQYSNIFSTCTILHTCLDVMTGTEAKQRHKSVFNRNQAHEGLQRNPVPR